MTHHQSVPGLDPHAARTVCDLLQDRLNAMIDLQLTLKHVHWNVVGPGFAAVHEMLDQHVEAVRAMSDVLAERIATLGGEPVGTPGFVAKDRRWDDYELGRATVSEHLTQIDRVYDGIIVDHRAAIERTGSLDPVTQDRLIEHTGRLEMFQWFVRAHLESGSPAGPTDAGGRGSRPGEMAAGRGPTPHEALAAERSEAPDVAGPYREMTRRGASTKGEGRV